VGSKFVNAACGRSHSLLVTNDGEVWSAGWNNMGQCGHPPQPEISSFQLVIGPWSKGKNKDRVIQAAAGITFSLVLTEGGKVYSFGSAEKGQLGNGKTGEHIGQGNRTVFDIESEPIPVKGLDGKKIVQIACGQQHSVVMDDGGLVYAFGFNGYCRLGLGNQQDVLAPKLIPQFTGGNPTSSAKFIAAGPTNTVVVDQQQMYWMAGKWKTSGDGSSGQPYTTFRYMQDIAACKIIHAASGGVTHFATTPDANGGTMTVGWGQNAYNFELGLGEGQPKSAVKPLQVHPLNGIDVFDIAAGQNTTFLIASPNELLSELPRHPADIESPELCLKCHTDRGESEPVLECEKCEHPYHLGCLTPPLTAVPDGEWFCDTCADEHEPRIPASIDTPPKKPTFSEDALAERGPAKPTKKRRVVSGADEKLPVTNKKRK